MYENLNLDDKLLEDSEIEDIDEVEELFENEEEMLEDSYDDLEPEDFI